MASLTSLASSGSIELSLHVFMGTEKGFKPKGTISVSPDITPNSLNLRVQEQLGLVAQVYMIYKGKVLNGDKDPLSKFGLVAGIEKASIYILKTKPTTPIDISAPAAESSEETCPCCGERHLQPAPETIRLLALAILFQRAAAHAESVA